MKKKIIGILGVFAAILLSVGLLSVMSFATGEEHACTGKIRTEIMFEGTNLVAQCRRCHDYIYPQRVSIDLADGTVFCEGKCDIKVIDTGWSEVAADDYIVLYQGDGDTEYAMTSTPPTKIGDYIVFIALVPDWEYSVEAVMEFRTTPIHFSIKTHQWNYSADGYSLNAKCANCGISAEVTLDKSAVLGAVRSADPYQVCDELFYDKGWNGQNEIKSYVVLYNGIGVDDNGKDVKYVNSPTYPEYPGKYTAKLAVPTENNNYKDAVCTKELSFYVAGIPINDCEIISYTDNEIAGFTQPQMSGKTYQVGTASELLWCVYNQSTYMSLVLTNDIILNPMLIESETSISCGSETIYKWPGFGEDNNRVAINIDGAGYTIYGIYNTGDKNGSANNSGFICSGSNVQIKNLTIANSYFNGRYTAGAFVGDLCATSDVTIENCRSINNSVNATDEAGGFIGWISSSQMVADKIKISIENCINDSYVAANHAGGIVGKSAEGNDTPCYGTINNCQNYGKITGNENAAGIFARLTVWHHIGFKITNCLNKGYIKANQYESGIIAALNTNGSSGSLVKECVDISNNVSIGEYYFNCPNKGEIIARTGDTNYYQIGLLKLTNNYYLSEESAYPSNLNNAPEATRITRTQIKYGDICEMLGGHTPAYYYSNITLATCLGSGAKNLGCHICNKVIETIEMKAHGHYYVKNVCIYCEEDDPFGDNLSASIISSIPWIATILIVAVLVTIGVIVIVKKKNKLPESENK